MTNAVNDEGAVEVGADVVVVGAGVVGALCALHIARSGRAVTVVSDRHFGGTTPSSTAVLRTTCDQPELAALSLAWYRTWNESQPPHLQALTYSPLHMVLPAEYEAAASVAARRADASVAGMGARALSGSLPLDYDRGKAVVYVENESAYADPALLTLGLLLELTRRRGHVIRAVAHSVERRGGSWMVHTSKGVVTGTQVVVAAGSGTMSLVPAFTDVRVALMPLEVALVRTRLTSQITIMDMAHDLLVRSHPAGLLATTRRKEGAEFLATIRDRLTRVPILGSHTIEAVARARVDVTADGVPLVGQIDDGLFVASGFGATGLKLAPAVTAGLIEAMTVGQLPATIAGFDPARTGTPSPDPLGVLS